MKKMITVDEAEQLIQHNVPTYDVTEVPFDQIQGRVLRQNITADRDLPPYNRVTMDGIAFAYDGWETGRRDFAIAGIVKAGEPATEIPDQEHCVEIMTGAVLPESCDCVIRVEDIKVADGIATVHSAVEAVRMQNVHIQGSDSKRGDCLLQAGQRLLSAQVAIPASTGCTTVQVDKRPRIAIVATGDELKNVADDVLPHQIRQTNTHAIRAALIIHGYADVTLHHFVDERLELLAGLQQILQTCDVLILSGGVSMGKFDLVPGVLEELQVRGVFHKVQQRPGKPLWFGVGTEDQAVYGLPGNPVSAVMSFHRYILPQLKRSAGLCDEVPEYAVLAQDFTFGKALTYFLPVQLSFNSEGQRLAIPVKLNGSGDFAGLVKGDGFIELAAEQDEFSAGTVCKLYRWQD
jgi:molybdopterin molybdotransferase